MIITVGKLTNYCVYSCQRFAEAILHVVLFTVLCFKWSVKKHCVGKVLMVFWEAFYMGVSVITITTDLVTNLLLFPSFLVTKTRINFSTS